MQERSVRDERRRPGLGRAWLVAGAVMLAGCGGLTENDALPPEVRDPALTRTPEGAVAAYRGVRHLFEEVFHQVVLNGALLTDELGSSSYGRPIFGQPATLDRRHLPEEASTGGVHAQLHRVRGQAGEAVGLLAAYAPDAPSALRGHAYALAGFAEVFLADLFCSGIPLSTVSFEGDYTFRPGSTTAEVYQHALALFDTALTLTADSARVLHLAQVGRGRALLASGQYAEAGQAVSAVPDGFSYTVVYGAGGRNFVRDYFTGAAVQGVRVEGATMTDREGGNGLPYLSSSDPRVAAVRAGTNAYTFPIYRPAKYAATGIGPMVVADWIEARLIAAEAALHGGGDWLGILNALRTDGTFDTQPNAADPAKTDTLWHAGSAGVAGLRPLQDPGSFDAQVNLLFEERGYWLFVTGHRQGDLRRLVREYGRDPESVYPSGAYPDGQGVFGTDVTLPVPEREKELNPYYTGCIARGA